MLDNNLYNLMLQLTQEHKSLWRIKAHYLKDADGDEAATAYWRELEKDKEEHIEDLLALIKERLNK